MILSGSTGACCTSRCALCSIRGSAPPHGWRSSTGCCPRRIARTPSRTTRAARCLASIPKWFGIGCWNGIGHAIPN